MKNKKFLPLYGLLLLTASCGENEAENPNDNVRTDTVADATDVDEKKEMLTTKTCYAWISGKDSILLSVEQTGTVVTGELHYLWFEKDSNRGSIKGEMRGDTLVADYTFMAEGMESVRKEFFLKKGDDLVIGNIDYEHDEEPYEAKDAHFKGEKLKKVDCK